MRIGELARRAGVNIETLRYYERRGLLAEPPRGPNGHREYDEETVRFVLAVKEAQGLGFTLSEIAEHTRLTRGGDAQESIRIRLAQKIDEVDAKLASLQRVRDELARVLGCACDSLDHCTCGAAYLARGGRDPRLGSLLHVTNGESAGNTLRQTALGGAVLSWQDVLHEGPVPDVTPAELRRVRARFLSECGWGSERSLLDAFERRDRLYEHALDAGTEIVLWFEHDLYDQLQLLQVLAGAREGGVELIQADDHLGPLHADEIEALWPRRVRVTAEMLDLARESWDAFRAPEPTALARLLHRDTSALPHLGAATRRLLEELPDARSGLSRTERQLLEPLVDGPRRPGELFVESQSREDAAFAGDTWVWKRLAELQPLVEKLPPPPPLGDVHAFLAAPVALTPLGRDVLAGKADRVGAAPLERWLAGTRLGGERDWRWNGVAVELRG
ncbi:MAG TPA: MerR family transcriptional regulator [Gaiellaceae bacterium]|nr:MerR family transcriptional regulator [Gaiellaceae bacterium]